MQNISGTHKIGILGAGQLGRMLALEAHRLGLGVQLYDPATDACANQVANATTAEWNDTAALIKFANSVDSITLEFENIPLSAIQVLAQHKTVLPNSSVLHVAQDRLHEKTLFGQLNIATTIFFTVTSLAELQHATNKLGLPAVLKTRRLGYDGKGQFLIQKPDQTEQAWQQLGANPDGLILEEFISFQRELSLIAVRDHNSQTKFYPLTENHHAGGILRFSIAPATQTEQLQTQAEEHCTKILKHFNYVGVLAVEFFERNGMLLANEIAPRVHNSGHWTQNGATTNQFENHMRAVAGLPLGDTNATSTSAMFNLIGHVPSVASILSIPDAKLHLYGKTERAGRKLGHINLTAENHAALKEKMAAMQKIIVTGH